MGIQIIGRIAEPKTIAEGSGIREIQRLCRIYGPGRWKKRKGIAKVRFPDGSVGLAEVHWYEAHGIGRKEYKIKRIIGDSP